MLSSEIAIILFFILPLALTKCKLTLVDVMTNTSIIEFKKI